MVKDNKKFVASVGLVIVLNVILITLIYSLLQGIGSKKRSVFEIKKDTAFYVARIKNINEINKSLVVNKEAKGKIESVFLDENSLINFIKELEYFAQKTGMELDMKGVRILKETNSGAVFNFIVEGSFSGIYRYLTLLENSRYQLRFEGINIQKSLNDENWVAALELKVLSFRVSLN